MQLFHKVIPPPRLNKLSLPSSLFSLLSQIFIFLISLSILSAILNSVYENTVLDDLLDYIPYVESEPNTASGTATLQFFSYIILLNTLVPISLYVRYASPENSVYLLQ